MSKMQTEEPTGLDRETVGLGLGPVFCYDD